MGEDIYLYKHGVHYDTVGDVMTGTTVIYARTGKRTTDLHE